MSIGEFTGSSSFRFRSEEFESLYQDEDEGRGSLRRRRFFPLDLFFSPFIALARSWKDLAHASSEFVWSM